MQHRGRSKEDQANESMQHLMAPPSAAKNDKTLDDSNQINSFIRNGDCLDVDTEDENIGFSDPIRNNKRISGSPEEY